MTMFSFKPRIASIGVADDPFAHLPSFRREGTHYVRDNRVRFAALWRRHYLVAVARLINEVEGNDVR